MTTNKAQAIKLQKPVLWTLDMCPCTCRSACINSPAIRCQQQLLST